MCRALVWCRSLNGVLLNYPHLKIMNIAPFTFLKGFKSIWTKKNQINLLNSPSVRNLVLNKSKATCSSFYKEINERKYQTKELMNKRKKMKYLSFL